MRSFDSCDDYLVEHQSGTPLVMYSAKNSSDHGRRSGSSDDSRAVLDEMPMLVFSPLGNAKAQHITAEDTFIGVGIKASATEIPAGYTLRFVLSASYGINQGMMDWGDRLLKGLEVIRQDHRYRDVTVRFETFSVPSGPVSLTISSPHALVRLSPRISLFIPNIFFASLCASHSHSVDSASSIGFWTDNGGYYHYSIGDNRTLGSNYEEVFRSVKEHHDELGLPFRHWQFDSWFYPKDGGVSPGGGGGAVVNWTAMPDVFPHGMAYIQSVLQLPMIMHNRQWSPKVSEGKEYDNKRKCRKGRMEPERYRGFEGAERIETDRRVRKRRREGNR